MSLQLTIIFRLLVAFLAGLLIGYDRERIGKAAGIKTQMLVCVGSALFSSLSVYVASSLGALGQDPTRVMAQIVSGVGFLGAGVILKNGNRLSGVTTAATIWTSAAIGTAIGCGFYLPAAATVVLVLLLSPIAYLQYKLGSKGVMYLLSVDKNYLSETVEILLQNRIREVQKSVHHKEVQIQIMTSDTKNNKLIEDLNSKKIKYSLEPTED